MLYSVCQSIFTGLYALNMAAVTDKNAESILLFACGGIFPSEYVNVINLILFVFPNMLVTFFCISFIYNDYRVCAVYVFTRIDNKAGWFVNKALKLFLYSFAFWSSQIAMISAISFIGNIRAYNLRGYISIAIFEIILLSLSNLFFILLGNIISLKSGVITGFLCVLISYSSLVLMASSFFYNINKNFLKLLPTSQAMLILHQNNFLANLYSDYMYAQINGFRIIFSIVYIIFLNVLLVFLGTKIIKNLELIGFEREV